MRPAARVVVDGRDITANLIPAPFGMPLLDGGVAIHDLANGDKNSPLVSLTVTDAEGLKSDSVELTIDNREKYRAPKKGAKIKVWLGYAETGLVYMGSYTVDQWNKSGALRTLTVSAKAADLTGDLKSPKSRSYHNKTVGEIVEQIGQYHEMEAKVHPDLRDIRIGHIDQSNESDFHFLTRLSKRIGGNFKPADGMFIMNKAGSGTLPSGEDAPVFPITEADITSWQATGSERGSYVSASATWIDPKTGERQTVVRGKTKVKGPRFKDRRVYKTEDEAERAAQSALDGLNRGKVSLNIEMPGNTEIFAGAFIEANDIDPDVDGLFVNKNSTHTLDSSGLRTSLQCESKDGGNDTEDDNEDG